jgi:hypothetical protein
MKIYIHRKPVLKKKKKLAISFIIAKNWNKPKCSSTEINNL